MDTTIIVTRYDKIVAIETFSTLLICEQFFAWWCNNPKLGIGGTVMQRADLAAKWLEKREYEIELMDWKHA